MNATGYEIVVCCGCGHDYVRVSIGLGCLPCGSCGHKRLVVKDLFESETGFVVDVDSQKVVAGVGARA